MSNNNKTPAIRFKGFTDAWEQREIGEWGSFYYGHSCPKWSVTEDATTPCIRYGEMYTKFGCKIDRVYSYTNIPKENLKFSKGTEVLVPRVGEDPMDYNHCTWLSLANVAIGEMISVYNTKQNPLFTAIMFNATLKYEFAKRVEGGSVTNLYYEKLLEIPVSFPNIEEQKKIASLIENIEALIVLHQRKLEKLRNIKQSMLKKMFPQNGANKSEIRFKGFTDAWEQRKLSDLFEERNEQAPMDEEYPLMAFIANIGVAPKGDRYDRSALVHDEKGKKYKRTEKGDFIYSSNNLETGSIGLNNYGNACISPVYSIFKSKHTVDPEFMGRILLRKEFINQMVSFRQGVVYGQWKIHEDDFLNLDILVPQTTEQQKIGEFFSELDKIITLHQRKCDKYTSIKSALIRKLFPST